MLKAKKGGGKAAAPKVAQEPAHDPSWGRCLKQGIWERPIEALPSASAWPTWGALRERILLGCTEIRTCYTAGLGDGFVVELVRMSPPNLNTIQLKGSDRLSQFVVTPDSCFPSLKLVDLSSCTGLECVLIQSSSLEVLDLSHCTGLKKVVLQCPNIRSVSLADCTALQTLTIPEGGGKVNLDLANCPLDGVGSRVLD